MISKMSARSMFSFVADFINDESGAELVEFVLVIGLIAVVCLLAVKEIGPKVGIRWGIVDDAQ